MELAYANNVTPISAQSAGQEAPGKA